MRVRLNARHRVNKGSGKGSLQERGSTASPEAARLLAQPNQSLGRARHDGVIASEVAREDIQSL